MTVEAAILIIVGFLIVIVIMLGVIVLGWNKRLTAMHNRLFGAPSDFGSTCGECGKPWPCPTLLAIGVTSDGNAKP